MAFHSFFYSLMGSWRAKPGPSIVQQDDCYYPRSSQLHGPWPTCTHLSYFVTTTSRQSHIRIAGSQHRDRQYELVEIRYMHDPCPVAAVPRRLSPNQAHAGGDPGPTAWCVGF